MLADDLRRVQALGQGPLILELSQKLLAGIRGAGGCGQAQGVQVLDLECLGIIGLAGDGDNLVILVQVEELDLLGELLEGSARTVNEFLVGSRKL